VRFETVHFELDAPIASVTLDRPELHNAYSLRMRDELFEVFDACRRDEEIRVVVLRGAGPSFCAGADLTEFGTAPSPFVARRIRFERDVWSTFASIPVPIVAGLHGHVIGSGLELATLSTYRVAAHSATIRMPETQLGLLPAAGATQTLPARMGPMRARSLLYRGGPISAEEALRCGLADEVVADDDLADRLREIAERIATVPRETLCAIVRLLRLQLAFTPGGAARIERLVAGLT